MRVTRRTMTMLLVAALAIMVSAQPACAQVISAAFPVIAANEMAAGDIAGVIPVGNWNNVAGVPGLIDDSGAVAADYSFAFGVAGGGPGDNAWTVNPVGNNKMMAGHIYSTPSPVTMTVTGLTYAEYDVYVYYNADGLTDNYQDAIVNGITKTVYENGTSNSSFVESIGGSNGNYVLFEGVTGSTMSLVMNVNTSGATAYSYLTGVQIAAVPEPTTLGLLAAGGLAFLRRKR